MTAPGAGPVVRAAGGVVTRPGARGEPELAVVHRPRYDDWTLPKGKLEPGESDEAGAVREVLEETGLVVRLGLPAGEVRYRDRRDRPKVVRYWHMTVVDGAVDAAAGAVPNDEVDRLEWWSAARARHDLTYPHDRELVERLQTTGPDGG